MKCGETIVYYHAQTSKFQVDTINDGREMKKVLSNLFKEHDGKGEILFRHFNLFHQEGVDIDFMIEADVLDYRSLFVPPQAKEKVMKTLGKSYEIL